MLPQFAAVSYDRMSVVTCVVVIFRDDQLCIYLFINIKLYFKLYGYRLVTVFCMCWVGRQ
jgi:hypothetical protein